MADWPFLPSTPMTRNGWLLTRTISPMGLAPAPKTWSRTPAPSTTTRAARSTSSSVKKLPSARSQARMSANADPVPWTWVCQLPPAATIWVRVLTPGETPRTPLTRAAMAAASSSVRVVTAPCPMRTPPTLAEPAETVITSVPRLATRCSIEALAPSPSAIITITAPTPMMMPSEVSADRSLLRVMASNASPIVLVSFMATAGPAGRLHQCPAAAAAWSARAATPMPAPRRQTRHGRRR